MDCAREGEERAAALLAAKRQAAFRKYNPQKRGLNQNLKVDGGEIAKRARVEGAGESNKANDEGEFATEREGRAAALLAAKKQAASKKYNPLKRGLSENSEINGGITAKMARAEDEEENINNNNSSNNNKVINENESEKSECENRVAALLAAKKQAALKSKQRKGSNLNSEVNEGENAKITELAHVGEDQENRDPNEGGPAKEFIDPNPLKKIDNVDKDLNENIAGSEGEFGKFPIFVRPVRVKLTKEFPKLEIRKLLIERARFCLGGKIEVLKSITYEPDHEPSLDVPDPEFHDFDSDRTEREFQRGQVWVAYDDDDGMPRFYAYIHKVLSLKPFRVRMSYLSSRSTAEFGPMKWIGSGFSKSTGFFRIEKNREKARSVNLFSHRVEWEKGPRGMIRILPKKGETWAVYKNWSRDWNPCTDDAIIHQYEMVEVRDEYSKQSGIGVVPLIRVSGFKTVYKRDLERGIWSVKREEMFRFSHRVPCFSLDGVQCTGGPGVGSLDGCVELDPACTPLDHVQFDNRENN